jgi:hypothetical protein
MIDAIRSNEDMQLRARAQAASIGIHVSPSTHLSQCEMAIIHRIEDDTSMPCLHIPVVPIAFSDWAFGLMPRDG